MVLEGKVNGGPRKKREKTISDEINEENEYSTGDDNSDDTDSDSSSQESEEQQVFNKKY
jgi:hypothetical protein